MDKLSNYQLKTKKININIKQQMTKEYYISTSSILQCEECNFQKKLKKWRFFGSLCCHAPCLFICKLKYVTWIERFNLHIGPKKMQFRDNRF